MDRRVARTAVAAWLTSRAALTIVTVLGVLLLTGTIIQNPHAAVTMRGTLTPSRFLDRWQEWDAFYFTKIATRGYWEPISASFFPLYPLLLHLAIWPFGGHHALFVGMLLNNLATLAAFAGIGQLIIEESGQSISVRHALALLTAYPLAFFLAAAYSDGVFLALAVWAMLCARRSAWRWAIALAFLAGLTRITAITLILPLGYEYGRQQGWWRALRARKPLTSSWRTRTIFLGVLAAVPLAIASYSLYLAHRFGDPLLWLHAESWGFKHVLMWPWASVAYAGQLFARLPPGSFVQARVLVDLVPLILAVVLLALGARRQPAAFTLYALGVIALCVAAPIHDAYFPEAYTSAGRYLLAAFPLVLTLEERTRARPTLRAALIQIGWATQALLLAFFLSGGWLI